MNKIESQKEKNRARNKQRYHEDEEYRTNKNEKDNRRNKKRYRTDETYREHKRQQCRDAMRTYRKKINTCFSLN